MSSDVAAAAGTRVCPNCGANALAAYCGSCGQSRKSLDQSVWTLLRESAADLFNADGRALRTLRLLMLQPGYVTAQYLAGRRAFFTPPFRLYLAASAAFFTGFLLTRSIDQAYYDLGAAGHGSYADTMARVLILSLPVFAVVLKLLYLPSRRPLLHHAIFTLHAGAAALLWGLALTVVAAAFKALWGHYSASPAWLPDFFWWLYLPGLVAYVAYVAVALRTTYGSGWPGAAIRTVVLFVGVGALFLVGVPWVLMWLRSA